MDRRNFFLSGGLTVPTIFSGAALAPPPPPMTCSFNVQDYGAKGDGATDDTSALRTALNAVGTTGGMLCFPPGTYITSGLLAIKSNTWLKGSGMASVIKRAGTATDSIFFSESVSNVTVESIALDINGPLAPAIPAKSFASVLAFRNNCSNLRLRDLKIYDSTGTNICCRHGILVLESDHVWIENCHLMTGLRMKAGGIGDKLVIAHNIIEESFDNALTIATPNSPSLTTNYIIRNNIVQNATGVYIYVGDDGATVPGLKYNNIIIDGNVMTGPARTAMLIVRLANQTERVHIINNIFHSNAPSPHQYSAGLQTTIQTDHGNDGNDFLISGNTIDGKFDHAGIWIQSIRHARIVNNQISNVDGAEGIRINKVSHALVCSNVIQNCRRGIWFRDSATDVDLVGNSITGCSDGGILMAPAPGSEISVSARFVSNTVTGSGGPGIEQSGPGPFDTHYLFNDLRNNSGGGLKGLGSTSTRLGNMGTDDYILRHCSATKTWNPEKVKNGKAISTDISVPGARTGDTVTVGFSIPVPGRIILSGAVTANDQVTVTLLNCSGSEVNLGSGTLRADVWRH